MATRILRLPCGFLTDGIGIVPQARQQSGRAEGGQVAAREMATSRRFAKRQVACLERAGSGLGPFAH